MDNLTQIDLEILNAITTTKNIDSSAHNIRKNGKLHHKQISPNINIKTKEDQPGIDIIVDENTQGESVFIPVIVTENITDKVYNDFYIKKNAIVTIYAGCGIHNCTNNPSEHSGIHRFYVEDGAKVVYIENHYGKGQGDKTLNPVTEIYLEKNATLEMHTSQIKGVSNSIRTTTAELKENATLIIRENIKTHDNQKAKTIFKVNMQEKNSSAHIISRAVAIDSSTQEFESILIGNAESYAHSECDAIIEANGKAIANPLIIANHQDARLVHEATIGKIAGEQLNKLMTLGLTKEEAEEKIIEGFLK